MGTHTVPHRRCHRCEPCHCCCAGVLQGNAERAESHGHAFICMHMAAKMHTGTKLLVGFCLLPAPCSSFICLPLNLSPCLPSPSLSPTHASTHCIHFDLFSLSASSPQRDLTGLVILPPQALYSHLSFSLVHLQQSPLSQLSNKMGHCCDVPAHQQGCWGSTVVSLWDATECWCCFSSLPKWTDHHSCSSMYFLNGE